MSTLLAFIVEFLASVGATIKAHQQAKAAKELPREAEEIKAIGDDVAAIKAELAKTELNIHLGGDDARRIP